MNTQARNRDRSFTGALLHQLLKGCFVICGPDPAPQKRNARRSSLCRRKRGREVARQEFRDGFIADPPCLASGGGAPGLLHGTAQSSLGDALRGSAPTLALPTLALPVSVTLLLRMQRWHPGGSHAAVPQRGPRALSVPPAPGVR